MTCEHGNEKDCGACIAFHDLANALLAMTGVDRGDQNACAGALDDLMVALVKLRAFYPGKHMGRGLEGGSVGRVVQALKDPDPYSWEHSPVKRLDVEAIIGLIRPLTNQQNPLLGPREPCGLCWKLGGACDACIRERPRDKTMMDSLHDIIQEQSNRPPKPPSDPIT